ncbi:PepSY domain-containing protein [Burkholderia glumae]|uniref:PepSY domain-containing protein n=1 Tax=Burkholderia glumae TaxID=337 RepID=UPI00345C4F11
MSSACAVKPRGLRQSMAELHTWAGLLCGWLLYAMFLTGTVSYFKDELSQWMRPELAHRQPPPDPARVAQRVAARLGTLAAHSAQWGITLPTARSNVASAFWRLPPGSPYALHLGRFSDVQLRWLYFLVSLGGTAMVGTGLVMWTVKRRQQLADPRRPHVGLRLVERLNVASIAGLSIAMTSYLWANRLLPEALARRQDAEVGVFFAAWGATLLVAIARPARRAWIELLWIAAGLLALLPVLNALTTDRPLWRSVADGDWVYAGFDLMMWAFAALHALLAIGTGRHRARPRPAGRAGGAAHVPPALPGRGEGRR